jgi:hypothetical protein
VRADGDSDAARHKECQDITAVGAAVNVALAVAKVRSLRSLPWSVGSPLASLASLARRLLTPWRCTPPACVYRPWGLQSRGEHPRPSLRCVGACWMQVRCLGWLACPHAQPGTPPVGCHQLTNSSSSLSLSLSLSLSHAWLRHLHAAQGGAGWVSGSPALIADAVHSLSDLLSDGVTLYTMDLSRRPHDDTQPYGYGRIEVPPRALVPLHIEH